MPTLPDLIPEDVFTETDGLYDPLELLQFQAGRLEERTQHLLAADLQISQAEDRVVVRFVVTVPRRNLSCTLFEVHHRPNFALPARFVTPEPLPEYLQKKYRFDPLGAFGKFGVANVLAARDIENKWVASTRAEFVSMLQEVFQSVEVKSMLASLIDAARRPGATDKTETATATPEA